MTLPNAELSAMQSDIQQLMPDTCAILSVTYTSDGTGGWTESWGTTTASVACSLNQLSGTEALAAGAVEPYSRCNLILPTSATITPTNRVLHNGVTYNVISVDTDNSWPICRRAIVEAVR